MNVLVVNVQGSGTPCIETGLEIAQNHVDTGDNVVFLHCSAELLACENNRIHDMPRCIECIARRNTGLSCIAPSIKAQSFLKLTAADQNEMARLKTRFSSLEELRRYTLENFDIGMGVLSSLISYTRHPTPDLTINADLVQRLTISAYAVFRSIQNYLDAYDVNKVYVFNGRTANPRGVIRACQSRGVSYSVCEMGHSIHHYGLWDNTTPHSLEYTQNAIRERWKAATQDPNREILGSEFFQDRAKGCPKEWESFVSGQTHGLLPPDWNNKKCNIVIFTSSEDEFAAAGDEWQNKLYENQLDGLRRISQSLCGQGDKLHIYLRMHPNSSSMPDNYNQQFLHLASEFLTVIDPTNPVSTYTLMRAADKVVTFGSTTGIEAVFWGTSSILAGTAFYGGLGGTYNPKSHKELIDLLLARLPPKTREAALMYGYYFSSYGIPYRHYKPTDFGEGEFKDRNILRSHRWITRMVYYGRRTKLSTYFLNPPFGWFTKKRLFGKRSWQVT